MVYRLWRAVLIGGLLAAVGGIGARAQGDATPEPGALRNPALLADDALLTGEPCAAPCWRGITPGETAWDEALAILQADPTLENVREQTDANSDSKFASWGQAGGEGCCQMFSLDGEVVSILFLRFAPDITLGELFEARGEPSFAISAPASNDQAVINLIYPEAQMIVNAYVAGTTGSVSADSEVVSALLMSPEENDLVLGTSNLHEWRGYADYAAYSADAAFDVAPSMTATPAGG